MKNYNLFLEHFDPIDEVHKRTNNIEHISNEWVTVKTYDEFVDFITNEYIREGRIPHMVSFGHDLCKSHRKISEDHFNEGFDYKKIKVNTGYHAAGWLIRFCRSHDIKFPIWFTHSRNFFGNVNISNLIQNDQENLTNLIGK